MNLTQFHYILFDWGDTIMKDDPSQSAPSVEWPVIESVAGSETLLEYLHQNGWTVVLATGAAVSNEAQIRGALARLNLDQYFDKIYSYRTTGLQKSAAFYQYILKDLQANPAEVMMIGDSFEKDVLAANQVGLAAVWFNPSTPEKRNGALYFTVQSLAELLARFQAQV